MASRASRAASILVACLLWFGGCRNQPEAETAHTLPEPIVVPMQVVVVSDDDGRRAAVADTEHVLRSVEFANRTYAPAGIAFEFDPERDRSEMRSTLLNRMMGKEDHDWKQAKRLGDETAASFPGKLVVFYRHGPDELPVSLGFSWYTNGFVVMPTTTGDFHCHQAHINALAHEIGHYLGLSHTFRRTFEDLASAEAKFLSRGRNPAVFDGDGFADTPPDPALRRLECVRHRSLVLHGQTFQLPRSNIMSYYIERDSLSPSQIERVRWTLDQRLRSGMRLPTNSTPGFRIEVERMQVLEIRDGDTRIHRMYGFGAADWSAGRQLLVNTGAEGQVTLLWHVQKSRKIELVVYATRAPDYGRVRVYLDDVPLGEPIDLYAPITIPTGAIPLGFLTLRSGEHRLAIKVVGKNPASAGYHFGIDCLKDARW
jgi:hypothetical protein